MKSESKPFESKPLESKPLESKAFDVVICGGGLAGLTLALQVRRARPEARVLVVERATRPLPEACHKVGESTVEVGGRYFEHTLGLRPYLEERHLFKNGLRFFCGFPGAPMEQRCEYGPSERPRVPSFQLDRGRFENDSQGDGGGGRRRAARRLGRARRGDPGRRTARRHPGRTGRRDGGGRRPLGRRRHRTPPALGQEARSPSRRRAPGQRRLVPGARSARDRRSGRRERGPLARARRRSRSLALHRAPLRHRLLGVAHPPRDRPLERRAGHRGGRARLPGREGFRKRWRRGCARTSRRWRTGSRACPSRTSSPCAATATTRRVSSA